MIERILKGTLFLLIKWFSDDIDRRKSIVFESIRPSAKATKKSFVRGKWSTRQDYVFAVAGLFIGLTNFWTLSTIVVKHGYLTFMIIYMVALITFGFPILLIEMGIGQTTQVSTIRVFNTSIYFCGLGISQLLVIISLTPFYSLYIVYAFYYLFFTIFQVTHWNLCNNDFNTYNCSSSFESEKSAVIPIYRSFSTDEYWKNEILRQNIYPENRPYDFFKDGIGTPPIIMVMLTMFVWYITSILLLLDFAVSEKILWFTVLFPICACFIMTSSFFSYNNPIIKINTLLKIDTSYFLNFATYVEAYCYVSYTLFSGYGCSITMASYNHLYDNILRDSVIIIGGIFVSTSITTILSFALDSYFKIVENVHNTGGPDFFFVLLLRAYGNSKFWTLLALMTIVCFGLDTLMGTLENIFIIISDIDPRVRREKLRYLSFVYILTVMFCIFGCFLVTPFGVSLSHASESSPLISLIFVFFELIAILRMYGVKMLANTLVSILGFPCMKYFTYIVIVYIMSLLPVLIICKFYLIFRNGTIKQITIDIFFIGIIVTPILGFMILNCVRIYVLDINPVHPLNAIEDFYQKQIESYLSKKSDLKYSSQMMWDGGDSIPKASLTSFVSNDLSKYKFSSNFNT